ncbi:MAG: hypothetical protein LBT29_09180 [Flavobacteriaceae bacterium]|nr:hypothetical protein [Flavobacteriaceae bacterium]
MLFSILFMQCSSSQKGIYFELTDLKSENPESKTVAVSDDIISLRENETVFSEKHQTNFTFVRVVKDERTSDGKGFAVVEIRVMSTVSRPITFLLSTENSEETSKSANFYGKILTLEKLYPCGNKKLTDTQAKPEYSIKISVNSSES